MKNLPFLLMLLLPNTLWAASGDSLNPTTVSGGGTGWTYWVVDTINTSNDKRAAYSGTTQVTANATGFGISVTPTGTLVVDSIKVMIEGNGTSSTVARRIYNIQLLKAGSPVGTASIDTLPLTTDTRDWPHTGTGVGVLWGTTWTEADIESTTFGVQVKDGNTGTAAALNFDHVMVRVWYTDVVGGAKIIFIED